jgi:hypothetical protein
MGSFYNLLPKKQRIGIDLEKYQPEYIRHDFLTWKPNIEDKPCVAIGNPPFGYRGWHALAFLNRAAEFCEYVGFILPMSFQSDGKGSPKHRVNGMVLAHSEPLPDDLFVSPNGEHVRVNTLWQIWKKGSGTGAPDLSASDEYIDLFTVDRRKERLCGAERMKDCNIFLQRTYFGTPPKLVNDFSRVKYGCGYGIEIKKDKDAYSPYSKGLTGIGIVILRYTTVGIYPCTTYGRHCWITYRQMPDYEKLFAEALAKNIDNPKWKEGRFIGIKTVSNTKVGSIGQDFIEGLCKTLSIPYSFPMNGGSVRLTQNPWDIEISGVKFELKTATEDTSGCFQFNHIRYHRPYDAVLCLGVTPKELFFGVWSKADVVTGKARNLVTMEKGANASYKLTKKPASLLPVGDFEQKMKIFTETFI